MEIVNRVSRMSAICAKIAADDVKIGLVSTMGDIQPRHLSLIQTARTMADVVVLAIFAARLHFESDQEYDSYPRDFVHDVDLLRREKVDYLFNPTEEEIFPPRFSTFVSVEGFGEKLPGLSRRPLFTGMPTTILKMIQIVKPTFIFFDQKDALQSAILRKMIMDLGINTELVVSPSGRDAARHANGYGSLSESQKAAAAALHRSLRAAENAVAAGELQAKKLTQEITRELETESQVEIEYAVIADALTLEPLAKLRGQVLISVGVQIGGTSLNDSMLIEIPTGK
jgi:pantoate--beta-alanine ligase